MFTKQLPNHKTLSNTANKQGVVFKLLEGLFKVKHLLGTDRSSQAESIRMQRMQL